ncbi:MAG: Fe-only nitrogenase accessory protein AnfO [Desulfosporosinus sp.]|nr:Fe-only nitrogenase accessory protein AnfO [Desulfosporosinus sp.]
MKPISIFLNSEGFTASLEEEGMIRVYTQNFTTDAWEVTEEFEFSLVKSSSISELRKIILNMIQRIGDCRIFVAREVAGQLYSVLEAYKFSIYEVEGKPEQFLDSVLASENELNKNLTEKSIQSVVCYPEKTDVEGAYFLNLKAALNADLNLTSKKILLPFLAKKDFKVLEVICDHMPKWFDDEFEKQGLESTLSRLKDNEYKVIISIK